MGVRAPLPTGTVTFLMTDVEGSTRIWEGNPEIARAAIERHDALIDAAIGVNNGKISIDNRLSHVSQRQFHFTEVAASSSNVLPHFVSGTPSYCLSQRSDCLCQATEVAKE